MPSRSTYLRGLLLLLTLALPVPQPSRAAQPQPTVVSATVAATALAAGGYHTCALISGGGVRCWGNNFYGQLGDGTTTNRLTPVNVAGLSSGVRAIALGWGHTCALTGGGGVKCWGNNQNGELGDGTTTNRATPVNVIGLSSGVTTIAAGGEHTCALTGGGGVRCWGDNSFGQLGDGTQATRRLTPVAVIGLSSGVKAITAGGNLNQYIGIFDQGHTCALTSTGGVKCWGANDNGQLGNGTGGRQLTPVDVSGLSSGVTAIAAGKSHTCALAGGGRVKCWGDNMLGQLGDGTDTDRYTPVDVSGLSSGATAIATGNSHTCAVIGGGIKCWGDNYTGQLGDGTTSSHLTPVNVVALNSRVTAIAAGGSQFGTDLVSDGHTCAITSGGGATCWGLNFDGQIGDGTSGNIRLTPVEVAGLAGAPTDLGFRPNPNGYSFQNYGGSYIPLLDGDYSRADMELMFGSDAVCSAKIGLLCILKREAREWHDEVNRAMSGGHCYGMAVESLRFFKNLDQPSLYQSKAKNTFDLTASNAKRRIAYFFVEQFTEPARSYIEQSLQNTPAAILGQLRIMLEVASDPPIIAIFAPNKKGGHAITPYSVESRGSGVFWVHVYDNNYPGDANRYMVINTSTNIWSYNLGGGLGTWSGNATSKSLALVPISQHSDRLSTCPWCNSTNSSAALSSTEVWSNGSGNLLIFDNQGRRIGFIDSQLINEIPNAFSHPIIGGLSANTEPIYTVPSSGNYTILLNGNTLSQARSLNVTQFGPGYAASVDDVILKPATQDQLMITSNGTQMIYLAGEAKAATLTLALEGTDNSTQFRLRGVDVGAGQLVQVRVDAAQGKLVFSNVQTSGGVYSLRIERASAAGEQVFAHNTVSILAGDTQYINYDAWNDAGPIVLELDHGSNGSIDQIIVLDNEIKDLYLPMIRR